MKPERDAVSAGSFGRPLAQSLAQWWLIRGYVARDRLRFCERPFENERRHKAIETISVDPNAATAEQAVP